MKPVRVAADRWNFEYAGTGEPVTPIGGNILNDVHPGQGTLFDRFDANDVDFRLGRMAEYGLNCLRQAIGVNQVFDARTGLKAAGMHNWDIFITLCEKHGIYLMPVGGYLGSNDWFDAEQLADDGSSLDDACAFWEAFAGHYKDHPAIWAWDLRNELLYDVNQHMVVADVMNRSLTEQRLLDKWPQYLEARYGSLAPLSNAHGRAYRAFTDAPYSVKFQESPFDPCLFDFRNYLNWRGYQWCKRQVDIIRTVSPRHMIVSGNNGWLFPDMDLWLANGFHNRALHELFDFVTIHPYPAPQCLPTGHGDPLEGGGAAEFWFAACVAMARIDHFGKPVVMQEFGWYGGGESKFLCPLPYRSEEEHADYTRRLVDTLAPHINGFVNWPTFDMPAANDISNHGGLFTHDGRPKALARMYREAADRLRGKPTRRARGTCTLTYSLPGLYTSRPYQDRFWAEVTDAIRGGVVPDFVFV